MSSTDHGAGLESVDVITIVVDDVDQALDFYTNVLRFENRSDDEFEVDGDVGRWTTIGLPEDDVRISLTTPDEPYYDDETRAILEARIGTPAMWTFRTADCEGVVAALEAAGVEITNPPASYPWGIEATFADPFGNEFDLFEIVEE